MFDRNMRYIATSESWIREFDRGLGKLEGLSHYDAHLPEAWIALHRRGLAGELFSKDEDLWVHPDGTRIWLRWAVSPWRNEEGAIGGIIIITEDISRRRRIAVAADDSGIYDRFREGAFAYRVPVPSGRYQVTLKFQDPVVDSAGVREFDVLINGTIVLKRFDIFASAGGKLKGVDRSFEATSRGDILIEFRPVKGDALVSALSITSLGRGITR